MASPFEIEQAVHELLDRPYDPATFLIELAQAFGATESWAKRVRDGSGAKSTVADGDGVLWAKKFHGLTCAPGTLDERFGELFANIGKRKLAFRYAIATDGQALKVNDMATGDVLNCDLGDLAREYWFLKGLAGYDDYTLPKESEVDMQASALLRRLYDSLIRANTDWATPERQHDLNKFMTRMIFCLFAEDVGIFAEENLFTKTVQTRSDDLAQGLDDILRAVFATMNVPEAERGVETPDRLRAFPYVNGGLFGEIAGAESVPMPSFNRAARRYLLDAGGQDWGAINPDIFGSMIQAIVDEDERAEGGLHYTSVPNIMKVLGPLFLDELREELAAAKGNRRRLQALSTRLGQIRVFDPACGSGNFLVIAYRELREIEMQTFQALAEVTGTEWGTFSNIHLENFYGIEIKDFAAETARLSLYVAQFQMNQRFKENFGFAPKALPLTEAGQIHCGNALRMDWESVCPPVEEGADTYICGNPPYKGSTWQTKEQKADIDAVSAGRIKLWKSLDYVAGWFLKGADYCRDGSAKLALVSTNSICQGQQVPILWPVIFDMGVEIHLAHTSFKWANLATSSAGVTVVIIGLSAVSHLPKTLVDDNTLRRVDKIGPYLIPHSTTIVLPKTTANGRPQLVRGSIPADGGFLILSPHEANSENHAPGVVRPYWGARELTLGVPRRTLWFDEKPNYKTPSLDKRLKGVSTFRSKSSKVATREMASKPELFMERRNQDWPAIAVAAISSENRDYLPVTLVNSKDIVSGKCYLIFNGKNWAFGLLASRLHYVWIATVCVRMRTDFSYSNTLDWNTFPLPELTELQKEELTARAEEILLVRERHFPKSIAQLYDPEAMPQDLRDAHRRNDDVLEHIYIGRPFKNDTERLEHLFKLYAKMVGDEASTSNGKASS